MFIYILLAAVGVYVGKFLGLISFPLIYFILTNRNKITKFKQQYKALNQEYPKSFFMIMGYTAKLNGSVLNSHIDFANQTMMQFKHSVSKKQMQTWFNEGKNLTETKIIKLLTEINNKFASRGDIRRTYIELIYLTINSANKPTKANQSFIQTAIKYLNLDERILDETSKKYSLSKTSTMSLKSAYKILNINEGSNLEDVKKSRNRLLKKYHPDKLINSSDIEKVKSNELVDEINKAYNLIKQKK